MHATTKSATARLTPILALLLSPLLVLAGLTCAVIAAFTWATTAGWLTAGVACFAAEFLLGERTG